jgi:hypothetical protein
MRVLVCGGRNYNDKAKVFEILNFVHARQPILTIVEGGASGADHLASQWAIANGVPDESHPAEWNRLGAAAGPIRNASMLATGINLVIALPGGRGTADMVAKAAAAGVVVING